VVSWSGPGRLPSPEPVSVMWNFNRLWSELLGVVRRFCFEIGPHRSGEARASGRAQSRGSRPPGRETAPPCRRSEGLESFGQTGLAHRRSLSREDSAAPRWYHGSSHSVSARRLPGLCGAHPCTSIRAASKTLADTRAARAPAAFAELLRVRKAKPSNLKGIRIPESLPRVRETRME